MVSFCITKSQLLSLGVGIHICGHVWDCLVSSGKMQNSVRFRFFKPRLFLPSYEGRGPSDLAVAKPVYFQSPRQREIRGVGKLLQTPGTQYPSCNLDSNLTLLHSCTILNYLDLKQN